MKVGKTVVNLLKRRLVRGNKKRRDAFTGLNDFEGMLDVPYIDDGINNHKFDLFIANKDNRKNICLIDIHGGSYIFGEHRDNFIFGYEFLKEGYDFVAVDYIPNDGKRDTKESIDDCYKCIRFIFDNLEKFHLENDKFVITGDSAGGHFALLLMEASLSKELSEKLEYNFEGINFEMVLANSPVYDFVNLGRDVLTHSGLKRLFGPNYTDFHKTSIISPCTHFSLIDKPIFVSTCKRDFLRSQSLMLKEDAEKYGLKLTFVDIYSNDKLVDHVHNVIRPRLEESIEVNTKMMKFIEDNI